MSVSRRPVSQTRSGGTRTVSDAAGWSETVCGCWSTVVASVAGRCWSTAGASVAPVSGRPLVVASAAGFGVTGTVSPDSTMLS